MLQLSLLFNSSGSSILHIDITSIPKRPYASSFCVKVWKIWAPQEEKRDKPADVNEDAKEDDSTEDPLKSRREIVQVFQCDVDQ